MPYIQNSERGRFFQPPLPRVSLGKYAGQLVEINPSFLQDTFGVD